MNLYKAFYKGKTTEVQAETSYQAQQLAAKYFKDQQRVRRHFKDYDVTVMLLAKDGVQVEHSTGAI